MKKIVIFVFVAFISNAFGFQDKNSIVYSISAVIKDSVPMLKVEATFDANKTGVTDLFYDNTTWGNKNLFNCIVELRLIKEKGMVTIEKDSSRIRIKHAPELKRLHFEYFVKQDTKGDLNGENYYRPVIQKDYFHVFALELFVKPDADEEALFDITLVWENFPQDYTIYNSYGPTQRVQKLTDITMDTFLQAICLGGDYRVQQLKARNQNVSFVTRGAYTTLDENAIVAMLDETVTGLDRFWKKEDDSFFTVILSLVDVDYTGSTNGGTGLYNSFDAFSTDNQFSSIEQLVNLFNHELNHQWIGLEIANANEEEQYWFSEGFTTYYTAKLVAKNKISQMDGSFFVNEMNAIIKQHYSSEVKNAPNSAITTETFWGDPNYEKIPYNRGALFALYLDQKIQKASSQKWSLDDVLRAMLKDARESGQKLTHSYFVQTVNRFVKDDIQKDFKRHIEDGEVLELAAFFKAHNLAYNPTYLELKPMGFSMEGAEGMQITSVQEDSDAEQAGFKVGDTLLTFEENPKPEQKASYKVKRGNETIEISLLRKGKIINIPQLQDTTENWKILGL